MVRWRTTAVLLVIFLALVGVAYIITQEVPASSTPTPRPKPLTLALEDITQVQVSRGEKSVTLTLEGDQWRITAPEREDADTSQVRSRLQSLLDTSALEAFTPEGNLDQYGLTKPQARIALQTGEVTATLLVGDLNPTGNNFYVQVEGDPTVYVFSKFSLERVMEWAEKPPYKPTPTPTPTETPTPSETPIPTGTPTPTS